MTKVYILILTEEDGPVDSATYFYRDRIIGCYSTAAAANRAGEENRIKGLRDTSWRIEVWTVAP